SNLVKKISTKPLFIGLFITLPIVVCVLAFASGNHEHDDENAHQEIVKGPHNGRLLKDGDFTLELAIFEKGVPPEYRAWASDDGDIISPKDWHLSVELTRLGGKVDKFKFSAQEDFLRSQSEVTEPHSFDVAV